MTLNESENGFLLQTVKGIIISVLVTLISVLIFAFVLSVTGLTDKVISPVNQIIKLVSVFLGCVFSVRNDKYFIKGGLIGLFSALLSILLFALIAGAVTSWITVFLDLVFGCLFGIISGMLVCRLA